MILASLLLWISNVYDYGVRDGVACRGRGRRALGLAGGAPDRSGAGRRDGRWPVRVHPGPPADGGAGASHLGPGEHARHQQLSRLPDRGRPRDHAAGAQPDATGPARERRRPGRHAGGDAAHPRRGGVGAGIALSGALVAIVKSVGDWQTAWWSSAALTIVLLAAAWFVGATGPAEKRAAPPADREPASRHSRWFAILAVSYFLEGAGYIVAGTFLVAAISVTGPSWLSSSVW